MTLKDNLTSIEIHNTNISIYINLSTHQHKKDSKILPDQAGPGTDQARLVIPVSVPV